MDYPLTQSFVFIPFCFSYLGVPESEPREIPSSKKREWKYLQENPEIKLTVPPHPKLLKIEAFKAKQAAGGEKKEEKKGGK